MKHASKKYRRLFSEIREPQPPADLARKTLLAIAHRERRVLVTKLVGLGILFAASLAVAVTELTAAGTQIGQSGFFQFSSLFFSDFGIAMHNLPDFFLSMLESFPVFSAGIAIGGFVTAAWSFAGFVDDASILGKS
jgi:ABC-type phosphate/phosphonate transport system permease subunit